MKVFVYGTLLKGMSRAHSLASATFCGLGTIKASLYDLGAYPGIVEGDGTVYGELYDVDATTLKTLDDIEGYFQNNPRLSLYLRTEVEVTLFNDATTETAYTYLYNSRHLDNYVYIESGDYRRYKLDNKQAWYIAYGSNMSSKRILERIGHVDEPLLGYLDGFELVFNKQGDNGSAYANIKYRGPGYRCPFAAYVISPRQLQKLDGCVGESVHYVRVGLPFKATDHIGKEEVNDNAGHANSTSIHQTISFNTQRLGHIYIAHPNKLTEIARPTEQYLNRLRTGYREFGFEVNF